MVFWTPRFPTSLQKHPLQCKKPSHLKPCCQDRLLAATDRPLSNCWCHHLSKIVKVCGHFLLADSVWLMQYLRLYIVHTFDIWYIYIYILYIATYLWQTKNILHINTTVFRGPVYSSFVSPELLDLQGPCGPFPKGLCKSQEFKVG